jgi:hypothetical protein
MQKYSSSKDWCTIGSEDVVIVVGVDGVRVVHYQTGEVLQNDYIRRITFSTFMDSNSAVSTVLIIQLLLFKNVFFIL